MGCSPWPCHSTWPTPIYRHACADLRNFEGNAQAVRLVVSLQRLRLTYTQTAGLLKYLRPAYQPRPAKGTAGAYLNKKPGFYLCEEGFVAELQQVLGQAPGTRHPVAYICLLYTSPSPRDS